MRPWGKRAALKLFSVLFFLEYVTPHPPHVELNGHLLCYLIVREHMPEIMSRLIYINKITLALFAVLLFWVVAPATSRQTMVCVLCSIMDTS